MRAFITDLHLMDGSAEEPCDRNLVRKFAQSILTESIDEVIFGGDTFDRMRGGDDIIKPAADFLGDVFADDFRNRSIQTTFLWGNHEGSPKKRTKILKALVSAHFDPLLLSIVIGVLSRGNFTIEHGHRFDPWNKSHGNVLTSIGEFFTKVDHTLDHEGLNIEKLNPCDWISESETPSLDFPMHKAMNRYACKNKLNMIAGHSHMMYSLFGGNWSVYNGGSLTKGHKVEYILFDDVFASLVRE